LGNSCGGESDVVGNHATFDAKERFMTNVGKKTVLLVALALLVEYAGMIQAQQPTFYWTRDWQEMREFGYGLVVGARNNQNQSDVSHRPVSDYSQDENMLIQEEYSASVPGASAYGTIDIYYYMSDDNQPAFEFGTDIDGSVGGSVSSPGNAYADFGLSEMGYTFGGVTLSGETGTATTCRLTLDINWVGTNNFPYDEVYYEPSNGLKFIYASVMFGTSFGMMLSTDDDTFLYVEGWSPDSYVFKVSSAPLNALNGSFEVGPSEIFCTLPVGEAASYEIDTVENLQAFLPVFNNYGPCETTSVIQVNVKILADQ
jgi:hypothetical protein